MNDLDEHLACIYDKVYASEKEGLPPLRRDRWPRNRWEAMVYAFPARAGRVLEIGCGNGVILYNIADRVEELTGTEISERRCKIARSNLAGIDKPVEILTGNIEQGLDRPAGWYDTILWADVIEHVVDVFQAMKEVSRLLASGGTLITSTPNIAYVRYRLNLLSGRFPSMAAGKEGFDVRPGEMYDGGHLHYFTIGTLKTLYRRHGIRPVRTVGFGRRLGRLRNLWPSLLSGSAFVVGIKE